jgi:hypothetical protein
MEQDSTSKKSLLTSSLVAKVLAVLLVIAVGAGIYFYQQATADPQKTAEAELQETIVAVGKLMVLPTNETPTMATVSDPEKLKDQAFFVHSQKGDVVLIYSASQKAILYRPSLNKIIEVAPINTGSVGTPVAP